MVLFFKNLIRISESLQGSYDLNGLQADVLDIEWYEATKTIIRKNTRSGKELAIRKNSRQPLENGDLLYVDREFYIELYIKPCDCIVIKPKNMREMGIICFEIGNQHIPIYIDDSNNLCVAYEAPMFALLQRAGYEATIEERQLLKTHVLRLNNKNFFRNKI